MLDFLKQIKKIKIEKKTIKQYLPFILFSIKNILIKNGQHFKTNKNYKMKKKRLFKMLNCTSIRFVKVTIK